MKCGLLETHEKQKMALLYKRRRETVGDREEGEKEVREGRRWTERTRGKV